MPFTLSDLLHDDLLHADLLHDGDALAVAAAGVVAVALVAWHGIGLLACATARRWPRHPVWARFARLAPPLARRLAGVVSLTSIVFTPSGAHTQDTTTTTEPVIDEPFVRAPEPAAPEAPAPAPAPPPEPAPLPVPPAAVTPAARTHVVVAGDNLWLIAEAEIVQRTGDAHPSDSAIVPYWRTVIEQNRATLRSGDPSLIYPGELVLLP